MAQTILERVSRFQTVIWDWNGTLINDGHIAFEAERELFRRHGLPEQTLETRLINLCFPIENYYKKMGFDFTHISYEQISEEWLAIYETLVRNCPLFDGAREMIETLHRDGKRQFVLSAAPEDHVREMTVHHSIHEYFEGVYALPHAKADSKIERGRDLIREHQIDISKAVLVGDTAHDFEVSEALGISVLLVADGHAPLESLTKTKAEVLPTRYPKSRS